MTKHSVVSNKPAILAACCKAVLVTLAVPGPWRVPAPEMMSAAAGVKVADELTVIVPPLAIEKLPLLVTAALEGSVRL